MNLQPIGSHELIRERPAHLSTKKAQYSVMWPDLRLKMDMNGGFFNGKSRIR